MRASAWFCFIKPSMKFVFISCLLLFSCWNANMLHVSMQRGAFWKDKDTSSDQGLPHGSWSPVNPKIVLSCKLTSAVLTGCVSCVCGRVQVQQVWHVLLQWQDRCLSLQAGSNWTSLWSLRGEEDHHSDKLKLKSPELPHTWECEMCFLPVKPWPEGAVSCRHNCSLSIQTVYLFWVPIFGIFVMAWLWIWACDLPISRYKINRNNSKCVVFFVCLFCFTFLQRNVSLNKMI